MALGHGRVRVRVEEGRAARGVEQPRVVPGHPGELDEALAADGAGPRVLRLLHGQTGYLAEVAHAGQPLEERVLRRRHHGALGRLGGLHVQQVGDGDLGAGLGLVLGLTGELGQPVHGRVRLVVRQRRGEVDLGTGGVGVAQHLGEERHRDHVAPVQELAVPDHGHEGLALVGHDELDGLPQLGRVGLPRQDLGQRLVTQQEVDRVAGARAPRVGLVVRPERLVVLHDVRVVDVVHRVRRDGLARDDGRVVAVRRRLTRGVAAPVGELLGPAAGVGVVGRPGEPGGEGLRVDADLLLRGVAAVLALGPLGGPAARHGVVGEVEVGRVPGLAGGDGREVGLGPRVELVPEQRARGQEVRLEGRVPEELAAPGALRVHETVGRGEVLDGRQGVLAQRVLGDTGELRVVLAVREQHRVAEDHREVHVLGLVDTGGLVPDGLDPAGVPQERRVVVGGGLVGGAVRAGLGARGPVACLGARGLRRRDDGDRDRQREAGDGEPGNRSAERSCPCMEPRTVGGHRCLQG